MPQRQRALRILRPTIPCIVIALCLVCGLPAFAGGSDQAAKEATLDKGLDFVSHRMTDSEMASYLATFGVRDAETDYNVLVDGHGTGKAPPTRDSYEAMVGQVNVLDYLEPMALPAAFDLSESPSFPAVGNQGMQGSCTAWAVNYYAYGYIEAVDNDWMQPSEGDTSQLMSPAWTYNKVNGGVDRGSWEWDNMLVLKDWGTCTMANLPYDYTDWTDWGLPTAFREAPLHRIQEAFHIPFAGTPTVDTVKTLITQGIPVTFGIDANGYTKAFKDGNYILTATEYNSVKTNHANTFVGYDNSIADDGELGAFRVVNSWGSGWGDAGYYWLTYDAFVEMSTLLDLCFVEDIADYSPSMRAAWQFDPAPSRDAEMEVAIGAHPAPIQTKSPYYWPSTELSLRFPTYICLDITEFSGAYAGGASDLYVSVTAASAQGTLEGFKVELFETAYDPSVPTHCSGEAWNDPQATPGSLNLSFPYHPLIGLEDAVDESSPIVTGGNVSWVGVDHEWTLGGDAAQSGHVGDMEDSWMSAEVLGPVTVGFQWKVSSEAGGDFLAFTGDGIGLDAISGDLEWEARSFDFGPGTHTVSWVYGKNDSGSDLDDCGWIDDLTLSLPVPEPPVAVFVFHPSEGDIMTNFEFDASDSHDPDDPAATLSFRWDWDGDGTWDTDWSEEPVAWHTFDAPDVYTVRVQVMDLDGLTDEFEQQVTVVELIPEFGALVGPLAAAITALMVAASARRRRAAQGGLQR